MAFSAIIRRAASSSVPPLAVRSVMETQRNAILFSSLKNNAVSQELCRRTFLRTLFNVSSHAKSCTSDKTLLRVIETEIKCAKESHGHNRVEDIPDGFPFEIQDILTKRTISLRRQYRGEIIKVEVQMPCLVSSESSDDGSEYEDYSDDDDSKRSNQCCVPLVVSVYKASELCLEFGCTAYSNEITIDSLSVKEQQAAQDQITYEGPNFLELDDNLKKSFHEFLEIRGIKPSNINFLLKYLINKDSKQYLMWLKNIKKFIGK